MKIIFWIKLENWRIIELISSLSANSIHLMLCPPLTLCFFLKIVKKSQSWHRVIWTQKKFLASTNLGMLLPYVPFIRISVTCVIMRNGQLYVEKRLIVLRVHRRKDTGAREASFYFIIDLMTGGFHFWNFRWASGHAIISKSK